MSIGERLRWGRKEEGSREGREDRGEMLLWSRRLSPMSAAAAGDQEGSHQGEA